MDKVDWKFVLVLALHLMAVGVMYGKITAEVAGIGERSLESRIVIEEVRRSLANIGVKLAAVEAGREEGSRIMVDMGRRMERLEGDVWGRKGR